MCNTKTFNECREALEAERDTSSIREMAERRGIGEGAMRERLRYYQVEPRRTRRLQRIHEALDRGERLDAIMDRHGMTEAAMSAILWRFKKVLNNRDQYATT